MEQGIKARSKSRSQCHAVSFVRRARGNQALVFYALVVLQSLIRSVAAHAAPCSIIGYPSVADEFERSLYVVVGKATGHRDVPDPEDSESTAGTFYTVHVETLYKGVLPSLLEIYSSNDSGQFPLDRGRKYLLFIEIDDRGNNGVNVCGNSGDLADRETQRAFRKLMRVMDVRVGAHGGVSKIAH